MGRRTRSANVRSRFAGRQCESQLSLVSGFASDINDRIGSFPPSGPVKVQEDLVHLAFQVESLDKTMAELKTKGVAITDGPTSSSSGSRFIFIDAPDGYEIELIERPPGVMLV